MRRPPQGKALRGLFALGAAMPRKSPVLKMVENFFCVWFNQKIWSGKDEIKGFAIAHDTELRLSAEILIDQVLDGSGVNAAADGVF